MSSLSSLLSSFYSNIHKKSKKEKLSIALEFINKLGKDAELQCLKRYIYYTLYLHNKDKRAIAYRQSSAFVDDYKNIVYACYSGCICKICNSHIVPPKSILNTPQSLIRICTNHEFCSSKCRAINGFKAATEKNKLMPKEKRLEIAKKSQDTMLKKYGCKSPLCANSIFQDKIQNTIFEKYGVKKYAMKNKEVKEKSKRTLKEHMKNEAFRQQMNEKREKTCMSRYGTKYACQADVVKQKINASTKARSAEDRKRTQQKTMQTCLARYGTKYPSQSQAVKQKIKEGIAKSRNKRKEQNISFKECKTKIVSIAQKQYEVQSINEQKFAEWLIYRKGYSPNDVIGQYEAEYNDFIYNTLKTFPDFWIKSKNTYIEVKSIFTFFNMYSTKGKIEEQALQKNRAKAEIANQNGFITRWVICDKSSIGEWRFLLLPKHWWKISLDELLQLIREKDFNILSYTSEA